MPREEGAKPKLLRFLKEHVGQEIHRSVLAEIAGQVGSRERSLRTLRADGFILEYNPTNKTYFFPYKEPQNEPRDSRYISTKLKSLVMIRDNSTCQMCGRNVQEDNIKIHIDHRIPYEWGGTTTIENLQCLCSACNEGKKNFVANESPTLMRRINSATSCLERLRLYFNYYANEEIGVDRLSVIGQTREWTRSIRRLRSDYNMNIEYRPRKYGIRNIDCYIYLEDLR